MPGLTNRGRLPRPTAGKEVAVIWRNAKSYSTWLHYSAKIEGVVAASKFRAWLFLQLSNVTAAISIPCHLPSDSFEPASPALAFDSSTIP